MIPTTSGYSGKPLSEKLGIKPGSLIAVLNAPPHYLDLLQPLPRDVRFGAVADRPQLIHYFCTERHALEADLPAIRRWMRDDASLWVSWPKKTSGLPTDVTEHDVRRLALTIELVDNKICAVDETWSAMRVVVRLIHRQPKSKASSKNLSDRERPA